MFASRCGYTEKEDGEKVAYCSMSMQYIVAMLRSRGMSDINENDVIDFLDNHTMTSLVLDGMQRYITKS